MIQGMPGPGGSLGQCGVCGKSFVVETITHGKVHHVSVEGLDCDICVHKRCMEALEIAKEKGWEMLPFGPLRDAYQAAFDRTSTEWLVKVRRTVVQHQTVNIEAITAEDAKNRAVQYAKDHGDHDFWEDESLLLPIHADSATPWPEDPV